MKRCSLRVQGGDRRAAGGSLPQKAGSGRVVFRVWREYSILRRGSEGWAQAAGCLCVLIKNETAVSRPLEGPEAWQEEAQAAPKGVKFLLGSRTFLKLFLVKSKCFQMTPG